MATYLYCLVPSRGASPMAVDVRGMDDGAIRVIRAGTLDAVVSTVGRAPRPDAGTALRHLDVARAVMVHGTTPLPARFGHLFEDDDACIAALVERSAALDVAMSHVAGRVEMVVTARVGVRATVPLIPPGAAPAAPGPGREYLERLQATRQHQDAVAAAASELSRRLEAAVGPLVVDRDVTVRSTAPTSASVAHLVPREAVDAYRAALAPILAEQAGAMAVTGPLPPVSFARSLTDAAVRSSREER